MRSGGTPRRQSHARPVGTTTGLRCDRAGRREDRHRASTWQALLPTLLRARQRGALTDYDAQAMLGGIQTKLNSNCR